MRRTALLLLLMTGACGQPAQREAVVNAVEKSAAAGTPLPVTSPGPAHSAAMKTVDPEADAPGTPGGLPDDRAPLIEPKGPIDPNSAEAAGQVAQRYGGLLEQHKFAEARSLWGDGGATSGKENAQFATTFADIHSEVGKPFGQEGAAGSIYIQVPFRLYGTRKGGGRFNLVGPLTLRRVNGVPGATPAQLRWHIEASALTETR